jgi:hypothetical protein
MPSFFSKKIRLSAINYLVLLICALSANISKAQEFSKSSNISVDLSLRNYKKRDLFEVEYAQLDVENCSEDSEGTKDWSSSL